MSSNVWYIGSSPMNGICNERFYQGSITFYPTNERGNVYFTDTTVSEKSNPEIQRDFKLFIQNTINHQNSKNIEYIIFNDKNSTRRLCSDIKNASFVIGNDDGIIDLLNDKIRIRNALRTEVPTLPYIIKEYQDCTYNSLSATLDSEELVVQEKIGSGGDTTYKVCSDTDFASLFSSENKSTIVSVSKYEECLPINVTMVIGKHNIMHIGISVQLISVINSRFKYVGGDFNYITRFSRKTYDILSEYSYSIATMVQKLGYRGILGIDYICCRNGSIYFMELNPRFQSSSFMISRYLDRRLGTCLGELHYKALLGETLPEIDTSYLNTIGSFLNSNSGIEVNVMPKEYIYNGYSKCNPESYYRKIYNESLVMNTIFENCDIFERD